MPDQLPKRRVIAYKCRLKSPADSQTFTIMNMIRPVGYTAAAFLLPAFFTFGGPSPAALVPAGETPAAMSLVEVPDPIDVSSDGELLLLFLPNARGFALVNTLTGQRNIVSDTPNTGYYATISPDKRYVCFKDSQQAGDVRLQVPALCDIAGQKVVLLDKPAPAVGNPVASSRGQIACTVGRQLIVLNADLNRAMECDLGTSVNIMTFSPTGDGLHSVIPTRRFAALTWTRGSSPQCRRQACAVTGPVSHLIARGCWRGAATAR